MVVKLHGLLGDVSAYAEHVDWAAEGEKMKRLQERLQVFLDRTKSWKVDTIPMLTPLEGTTPAGPTVPAPVQRDDWAEAELIGRNLLGIHQGLQTQLLNVYNHGHTMPLEVQTATNALLTCLDHLIEVLTEHFEE